MTEKKTPMKTKIREKGKKGRKKGGKEESSMRGYARHRNKVI